MSIRVCCASIPLAAEYSPFSIEALPEAKLGAEEVRRCLPRRPLRCSPAVCDPRYVLPGYRRAGTVLEPPARSGGGRALLLTGGAADRVGGAAQLGVDRLDRPLGGLVGAERHDHVDHRLGGLDAGALEETLLDGRAARADARRAGEEGVALLGGAGQRHDRQGADGAAAHLDGAALVDGDLG